MYHHKVLFLRVSLRQAAVIARSHSLSISGNANVNAKMGAKPIHFTAFVLPLILMLGVNRIIHNANVTGSVSYTLGSNCLMQDWLQECVTHSHTPSTSWHLGFYSTYTSQLPHETEGKEFDSAVHCQTFILLLSLQNPL